MKKLLALAGDITFSSRIRASTVEQGMEYFSIRTLEDLETFLKKGEIDCVVVDLNTERVPPSVVIETCISAGLKDKICCYFSHVNVELEKEAEDLGVERIYRRSEFFSKITEIINPN